MIWSGQEHRRRQAAQDTEDRPDGCGCWALIGFALAIAVGLLLTTFHIRTAHSFRPERTIFYLEVVPR